MNKRKDLGLIKPLFEVTYVLFILSKRKRTSATLPLSCRFPNAHEQIVQLEPTLPVVSVGFEPTAAHKLQNKSTFSTSAKRGISAPFQPRPIRALAFRSGRKSLVSKGGITGWRSYQPGVTVSCTRCSIIGTVVREYGVLPGSAAAGGVLSVEGGRTRSHGIWADPQ